MFEFLSVVLPVLAVIVVAVAFALSLAHALELPGKMRLSQAEYYTVRPIYYPGFTIGGISEPLVLLLLIILLFLTPTGSGDFWLTLAALFGMIGSQAIYWLISHPVNKFWLQDEKLSSLGASFFAVGNADTRARDWTALRNRWEYSHVARAGLAFISFLALVIALAP